MTITERTTVADIAATIPSSVTIFERAGIDFCCGGRRPLAVACDEAGVPFEEMARAITAAEAQRPDAQRDWLTTPLTELADHIVDTYHAQHREQLPQLQAWTRRAVAAHGGAHPGLFETIERTLADLTTELQDHMNMEERILFPAIRARERGDWNPAIPLAGVIRAMEQEHDDAGAAIAELRRVTQGYEAPHWACATVKALYSGLGELEAALHVHVHLENNVLFPRALALTPAYRP